MTVTREAPPLKPDEQAPALRTLSAWLHWQLRDQRNSTLEATRRLERTELENRQLQLQVPHGRDSRSALVARIITELGGPAYGDEIGDWQHRVQVADVVAALRDLGAVRARRDDAQRDLTSVRRGLQTAQKVIDRAITDLDAKQTITAAQVGS